LEVLAALALTDDEFEQHMMVKDGKEPKFYAEYVQEVQRIIESNARLEFECIWNESKATGTPRSILSDTLSFKIIELTSSIAESNLWNNEEMKKKVLLEYCPRVLLDQVKSIETLLERVPESYLRAIFSRFLASRYVYQCGLPKNPEFAFFAFLQTFLKN
jgi:glutamate dehydrogenase